MQTRPQRDLQLTAPKVLQIVSPAQPDRTQLVSAIPSDSLLAMRIGVWKKRIPWVTSSVGEHDEGVYLR